MATTTAVREAVRKRAVAKGKKPTTAGINATVAANRLRTAAAAAAKTIGPPVRGPIYPDADTARGKFGLHLPGDELHAAAAAAAAPQAAPAPSESTADIYRRIMGSEPDRPGQVLTPQQYREQVLNQFEGSPQLGKIDVSKGYSGELAQATLAHLLRIGPQGYVGINTGKRDDREYQSVLEGARRYAAEPTGVRSVNPNLSPEKAALGKAEDDRVQGYANKLWNDLAAALGLASPAAAKAAVGGSTAAAKAVVGRTTGEREAVRARAVGRGKKPTTESINRTVRRNRAKAKK